MLIFLLIECLISQFPVIFPYFSSDLQKSQNAVSIKRSDYFWGVNVLKTKVYFCFHCALVSSQISDYPILKSRDLNRSLRLSGFK